MSNRKISAYPFIRNHINKLYDTYCRTLIYQKIYWLPSQYRTCVFYLWGSRAWHLNDWISFFIALLNLDKVLAPIVVFFAIRAQIIVIIYNWPIKFANNFQNWQQHFAGLKWIDFSAQQAQSLVLCERRSLWMPWRSSFTYGLLLVYPFLIGAHTHFRILIIKSSIWFKYPTNFLFRLTYSVN